MTPRRPIVIVGGARLQSASDVALVIAGLVNVAIWSLLAAFGVLG